MAGRKSSSIRLAIGNTSPHKYNGKNMRTVETMAIDLNGTIDEYLNRWQNNFCFENRPTVRIIEMMLESAYNFQRACFLHYTIASGSQVRVFSIIPFSSVLSASSFAADRRLPNDES